MNQVLVQVKLNYFRLLIQNILYETKAGEKSMLLKENNLGSFLEFPISVLRLQSFGKPAKLRTFNLLVFFTNITKTAGSDPIKCPEFTSSFSLDDSNFSFLIYSFISLHSNPIQSTS